MQQIFLFLEKNQPILYLILALTGFSFARWLWTALKEWRNAFFGLEREIAMRKLAQASAGTVGILVLMCGVFFISTFVVPALPADALLATPTIDILATPGAAQPGAVALTSAATPLPTAPGSEGCLPGKLEITSPRPNTDVNGIVTLVGTVDVPNFGFYKYEVSVRGTDIWSTISASSEVKKNADLGELNTSILTPGDYLLRVVALDNSAQVIGTCVISIRIKGQ